MCLVDKSYKNILSQLITDPDCTNMIMTLSLPTTMESPYHTNFITLEKHDISLVMIVLNCLMKMGSAVLEIFNFYITIGL